MKELIDRATEHVKLAKAMGMYGAASKLVEELTAVLSALPSTEGLRDALVERLRSELSDSYDCTRVWEAWSVGTMTEDDFAPVTDRIEEIADGILSLRSAIATPPASGLEQAVGAAPSEIYAKLKAHCDRYGAEASEHLGHLAREIAALSAAPLMPVDKAGDQGDDAMNATDMLDWFRRNGWMVAVHNDYRQHGRLNTFWLLTRSDGRWVKGEGVSDALALQSAMESADAISGAPAPHTNGGAK